MDFDYFCAKLRRILSKWRIYILGLVTLIGFPIPAFIALYYLEDWTLIEFLQLDRINFKTIILGLNLGIVYGFFAVLLLSTNLLRDEKSHQAKLLQQLKLNTLDMLFLSLCAGIGEELLFRVGIQFYLGPLVTSILFVALHGYYSLKNWRINLYGLLITPFILILAYSIEAMGLWFCIAAHFSYDMVMFKIYAGRKKI